MSKPMKKSSRIILGVFTVVLLLGACFGSVGLYAKKALNKPKFIKPEDAPIASASRLPSQQQEAYELIMRVYTDTVNADDIEGNWHTEAEINGDIVTPFSQADNAIISYAKGDIAGKISELYPSASGVKMTEAEDIPDIRVPASDITGFTAECGKTDENGNVTEDDYYFITLTVNPDAVKDDKITESDIFSSIKDGFKEVFTVDEADIKLKSVVYSFRIDRVTDDLLNAEITREYDAKAKITLTDKYSALVPGESSKQAETEFPYKAVTKMSFSHYGAKFTQRSMAVSPNDIKALPASVTVNSETTKDDYKLTFEPSAQGYVTIDEDGVMTVEKASETPIIITMTLDYDGHIYTDELTVYITELEVETNVG
ncbi:MAG: hypothetical protein K6F64_02360 [Clostridia bacterium]|nr:hypothetical protein [Clostridia bacterium]